MMRCSLWLVFSLMLLLAACVARTPPGPPGATREFARAGPTPLDPPSGAPSDAMAAIPERVVTTPFPYVALPAQPAPNFALSFGYGACRTTRILDTFQGTLTQFDLDDQPSVVPLQLSSADTERIYRFMVAIALFSYPEHYRTILPDTMVRVMPSTYPTYTFRVRNGDRETVIHFADAVDRPTTVETEQMRELVTLLKAIIQAQPAVNDLPPLKEACA